LFPGLHVPLFDQVLGDDSAGTPGTPSTLTSQDKLAMNCLTAGRTAKAIRLYKRTLADCERTLGPDHPYTFRSRNNLAMSYLAAGRTAEAIPLLERTVADCKRVLRPNHPDTRTTRNNLALAYRARAAGR
jgi:tetratricopeptide (TPR) repeat protein